MKWLAESLEQQTLTGIQLSWICYAFLFIRTPRISSGCFLPGLNSLSNSGFALGTFTGWLAEVMDRTFRILPMLCLTSWLRSFPAGILARYQDVIFCVSWLLLPRPAEDLEGLFIPSACQGLGDSP